MITAKEAMDIAYNKREINEQIWACIYEVSQRAYSRIREFSEKHEKHCDVNIYNHTPLKRIMGIPIPFTSKTISYEMLREVTEKMKRILEEDGFRVEVEENRFDYNQMNTYNILKISWYKK